MTRVYCKFQVEGLHRWAEASGSVEFLKHQHRHVFHVRVDAVVTDDDRQLEFLQFQSIAKLGFERLAISTQYSAILDFGGMSCEMMARRLLGNLNDGGYPVVVSVEVSEDGENGAVVTKES